MWRSRERERGGGCQGDLDPPSHSIAQIYVLPDKRYSAIPHYFTYTCG